MPAKALDAFWSRPDSTSDNTGSPAAWKDPARDGGRERPSFAQHRDARHARQFDIGDNLALAGQQASSA